MTLSGDVGTYRTGVFDTTNHGHVVAVAKTQTAFEKMAGKYGATGFTCSVYCYVLVGEGLADEIRDDAAVKRMPAPAAASEEGGRRWGGKHG